MRQITLFQDIKKTPEKAGRPFGGGSSRTLNDSSKRYTPMIVDDDQVGFVLSDPAVGLLDRCDCHVLAVDLLDRFDCHILDERIE